MRDSVRGRKRNKTTDTIRILSQHHSNTIRECHGSRGLARWCVRLLGFGWGCQGSPVQSRAWRSAPSQFLTRGLGWIPTQRGQDSYMFYELYECDCHNCLCMQLRVVFAFRTRLRSRYCLGRVRAEPCTQSSRVVNRKPSVVEAKAG